MDWYKAEISNEAILTKEQGIPCKSGDVVRIVGLPCKVTFITEEESKTMVHKAQEEELE